MLEAKLFLATISTVQLILVTLPALPKPQRKARIEDHLTKTRRTGALPPDNLLQYLEKD